MRHHDQGEDFLRRPQDRRSHPSSRTPRHTTPAGRSEPVFLTARDEAILRALARYGFLTCEQVTRLFYSRGSLAYVRSRMKRLSDAGYAQRLRMPSAGAGNTPWVYTVATMGYTYLKATGMSEAELPRPGAPVERSYLFLSHSLAVADFLIAAVLLSRSVPVIALADLRHDHVLRRRPVRVRLDAHEWVTIVPDAWLDFRIGRHAQFAVVLELDRGSEEQAAFKHKLRGLLAYARGPYQDAFGTLSITVALATTAGDARVARMRRWCEQVLRGSATSADADLFRLTALPDGAPDPQRLFLAPVWQQPFASQLRPLIDLHPAAPT